MVSAVGMVIELHELSDRLDDIMVYKKLENNIDSGFDLKAYQKIYRMLDNYDERIYQINLVVRVTEAFYKLSKMWIVSVSLKTVWTAAHFLGIGKIIEFVYEGYMGFKQINDINFFLQTIKERELAWHEKMWKTS